LQSAEPVQFIFSFGRLIQTTERNCLSDRTVETLLLVKANLYAFFTDD